MDSIKIDCNVGEVSDGYHTFNDLYSHRHALFIALLQSYPDLAWRANNNSDGSHWDGWFVAGLRLPTGDISYHMPIELWNELDGLLIETTNIAPAWDGHTATDVLARLESFNEIESDK